jgi:hypothetical protein
MAAEQLLGPVHGSPADADVLRLNRSLLVFLDLVR